MCDQKINVKVMSGGTFVPDRHWDRVAGRMREDEEKIRQLEHNIQVLSDQIDRLLPYRQLVFEKGLQDEVLQSGYGY